MPELQLRCSNNRTRGWCTGLLGTFTMLALLTACDDPSKASARQAEPTSTEVRESTTKQATKAPPTPRRTNGAMLFMPEPTVEFGKIADYEVKNAKVAFTNTGDQVLEVIRVQPTCGCTSTALKQKLFAPGEGAEIELTFRPKGVGTQTKLVKVHTNDSENPIQTIAIKAVISGTVTVRPKSLAMGIAPLGAGTVGTVTLSADEPTYEPTQATLSGGLADYTTTTMTETTPTGARKRTWRVDVALSPETPWGWHVGSLRIVGSVLPKGQTERTTQTTTVGVNTSVQGDLRASDSMFRLLILNPNSTFNKSVRLNHSQGKRFQILDATVEDANLETMSVAVVPLTETNGAAYDLILTGETGAKNGPIQGKVLLKTDIPGEEEVHLRIAGSVRKVP